MNHDIQGQSYASTTGIQDRLSFVRSVYLWLMGGFLVATLGAFSSQFVAVPLLQLTGRFFPWALFIAQFGALFFASSVSRRSPLNRFAFALFTYISGVIAGIVMMVVAQQSGRGVILAAFGMTAADFLLLTIIAFVSKKDFSFLRGFVIIGVGVMFFGSLIGAIFHLETLSLLASGVAVVACSAKILYDTSAMLRSGDYSDPAGFALSLFVSLYNIFLSILRLLGGRRN